MSFTERGNKETGGGGAGVGGRELSWGGVEFEVSVPCLSREVQLEVGPVGLELGGWGGCRCAQVEISASPAQRCPWCKERTEQRAEIQS